MERVSFLLVTTSCCVVLRGVVSLKVEYLSGPMFASDSRDGSSSSFVRRVTVPDADVLQDVSSLIHRGLRVVRPGARCCGEGGSSQPRTMCRVDGGVGVALGVCALEALAQLGSVAQVDKARESFGVVHCTGVETVGLVG